MDGNNFNSFVGRSSLFRFGARCIARIGGNFFLLLEVEIGPEGSEIERVFVIRITSAQAETLRQLGIGFCTISTEIPVSTPGREVNLICAFVEDGRVFLVFDVETGTRDELVLVSVPFCNIVG